MSKELASEKQAEYARRLLEKCCDSTKEKYKNVNFEGLTKREAWKFINHVGLFESKLIENVDLFLFNYNRRFIKDYTVDYAQNGSIEITIKC